MYRYVYAPELFCNHIYKKSNVFNLGANIESVCKLFLQNKKQDSIKKEKKCIENQISDLIILV